MNIYLLTQDLLTGYRTYYSCVVYASTPDEARKIHPDGYSRLPIDKAMWDEFGDWPDYPEDINVEYLGSTESAAPGVICASFNAE
jgi:hypothetical protein